MFEVGEAICETQPALGLLENVAGFLNHTRTHMTCSDMNLNEVNQYRNDNDLS